MRAGIPQEAPGSPRRRGSRGKVGIAPLPQKRRREAQRGPQSRQDARQRVGVCWGTADGGGGQGWSRTRRAGAEVYIGMSTARPVTL